MLPPPFASIVRYYALLLLGICLLWSGTGRCQSRPAAGEYYFDFDPGAGNGTAFTFTTADSVSNSLSLSVSTLGLGAHALYIRYRDSIGNWGPVAAQLFSVGGNVYAGEYFVDTDPGIGLGTSFSFTGGDSVASSISIPVSSFAPGDHKLYIRYKGNAGQWGQVATTSFSVGGSVYAGEYFVDTDPGVGLGTAFTFTGGDSVSSNIAVSASGIPAGIHKLYVRYKGGTGFWGPVSATQFTIDGSIVAGEYFIDTDPGVGRGTAISVTTSDSVTTALSVSTTGLSRGDHKLYIRYLDANNQWSPPAERRFTVGMGIAAGEYFIDTDPGTGFGTRFSFSETDTATNSLAINTASIPSGFHTLYCRYLGTNGQWGSVSARPFQVTGNVIAGEYFVDTDPGVGNGTSFTVSPGDSVNSSLVISGSTYPPGDHRLYVRYKSSDNQWGEVSSTSFSIGTGIAGGEYFIDTDPGIGRGTAFTLSEADSVNHSLAISMSGVATGPHAVYVRYRTANNIWGEVSVRQINVTGNITAGEYFVDTDPGAGNGTSFSVTTGDSVNSSLAISGSIYPPGDHRLYVRYKSSDNQWGEVSSTSFSIGTGIAGGEYFIDTDPGIGRGTGFTLSEADSVTHSLGISMSGVSTGPHAVYVRYRTANNIWGEVSVRQINVTGTITDGEYFVDTDPGAGNGTAFSVSPGDSVNNSLSISGSTYSSGDHRLYVRYKSSDGQWGEVTSTQFSIGTGIAGGEYFLDTDPGIGRGTSFTLSEADSVNHSLAISMSGVPTGPHALYIRYRTANNIWGEVSVRQINVTGNITGGEYFVDTDPGVGRATPLSVTPGDSVTNSISISAATLAPGDHKLYTRYISSDGQWGTPSALQFNIGSELVAGEYFVDTDPGVGAATALPSFTAGDSVNQSLSLPTTGLTNGAHTAYFRYKNAMGRWGTVSQQQFVVCASVPFPGYITGSSTICLSTTATLTDTVSGGVWSSTNPSVASITSTGVVRGNSLGTATISYTLTLGGCPAAATFNLTVNPPAAVAAIAGPSSICLGGTIALTDSTVGGTWTSSNTSRATVSTTGTVFGLSAGSAIITYTAGTGACTAYAVKPITVSSPVVAAIAGPTTVCPASTITFTNSTSGGVWASADTTIATVSSMGVVGGITTGSTTISYTVTSGGCSTTVTKSITVTVSPYVATITGADTVCTGSAIALSDSVAGGVWASSDIARATVSAGGSVRGIAGGSVTISYTVTTGCSATAIKNIFVNTTPSAGVITGVSSLCMGDTTILSDTARSGTWSSTNTSIASINAAGKLWGVGGGSATIYYSVRNGSCSASTNRAINIIDPTPSGISGALSVCPGLTATLSSFSSGGTWSSSDTTLATISATGVVTGIATGTTTITYARTVSGCSGYTTRGFTVNTAPSAGTISGSTSVCANASIALTNAVTGGTWSSSNTAIASVGGRFVYGRSAGAVTISYTVTSGCSSVATYAITVNPVPSAGFITGADTICRYSTATYTDTAIGGTWSSDNTFYATVDTLGNVRGINPGYVTLRYTVTSGGCTAVATKNIYVNDTASAGTLSGAAYVCTGATTTIGRTIGGGSWFSSDTAIAAISSAGVATGRTVGNATITYQVRNFCGTAVATRSLAVYTIPATPAPISGTDSACSGTSVLLSDTTTGGVWRSTNTALATISNAGTVTGLSGGTVTLSYTVTNVCGSASATFPFRVLTRPSVPPAIVGTTTVCVGDTGILTNAIPSGIWSSSDTTIARITATGHVSAIGAGTNIISYTVSNSCGNSSATTLYAVGSVPFVSPIVVPAPLCLGTARLATTASAGGYWSVSDTSMATINATTGSVFGRNAGTVNVSYTVTNSCGATSASSPMAVSAPPASAGVISGAASICQRDSANLSATVAGGVWSVSPASIASVNAVTGRVYGLSGGSANITYTVSNSCGVATGVHSVSVTPLPFAGSITGSLAVCVGDFTHLSDTVTGGIWSTSDTAAATIDAFGVVTAGGSPGPVTIFYAVSGACGTTTATATLMVGAAPYAGTISGATALCSGTTGALSSTAIGGVWYCSPTAVATINSSTGSVHALTTGTATVQYMVTNTCGADTVSRNITVSTLPGSAGTLSVPDSICLGSTTSVTSTVSGGVWATSRAATASVNASTGLLRAVGSGIATISYTVTNVCGSVAGSAPVFVVPLPVVASVSGPASICTSGSVYFTDSTLGGVWATSARAVASVSSAGLVMGITPGNATISYTLTTICGTATAIRPIVVNPYAGTISGPNSVAPARTISLSASVAGGGWSTSAAAIASVNATGTVFGVTAGLAHITYSVTTSCGTANAVKAIQVGYCTPEHDSALASIAAGITIARLEMPGEESTRLSDRSGFDSATTYEDRYEATNLTYRQNERYPAFISSGGASIAAQIWIDYNNDYVFDSAELVASVPSVSRTSITTPFYIGIPGSADTGYHRMRVVGSYADGRYGGGTYPHFDPCAVATHGDVRDYRVYIQPYMYFEDTIRGLKVCAGSTYNSIDSLLGVIYRYSGRTELFTVRENPGHGILRGFTDTVLSTGDTVYPSGLTYTPTAGYIGDDDFTVTVRCGAQTLTKKIKVLVGAHSIAPDPIYGNWVEVGNTIQYTNLSPGGVWASNDTNVATVTSTGTVRGRARGTTLISYTVTDTVCGTVTVTAQVFVNHTACTPYFTHAPASCSVGHSISYFYLPGEAGTSIADNSVCNGTDNYEDRRSRTMMMLSPGKGYRTSITIPAEYLHIANYSAQEWIDFNDNDSYEASESVGGCFFSSIQDSILIPATANLGVHRMRLVMNTLDYGSDTTGAYYPGIDPCGRGISYGDAREYLVNIRWTNHPLTTYRYNQNNKKICSGSSLNIDSMLGIVDIDTGQAITWTVTSAGHGSFSGLPATGRSNGGLLFPSGVVYSPAGGFTGYDVFTVTVSDSFTSVTIPVTIHVGPPDPGATSIYSPMYPGATGYAMHYDTHAPFTYPAGTWSIRDTAVATIDPVYGSVYTRDTGTTIITYSVTDSCGTSFTTCTLRVILPPVAPPPCFTCPIIVGGGSGGGIGGGGVGTGGGGGGGSGGGGGGCSSPPPVYYYGSTLRLSFSGDTNRVSLNDLLLASDPDLHQTMTWTVVTAPTHGSILGLPYSDSSNVYISPTSAYYLPGSSFILNDQFTIRVTDGGCSNDITISISNGNLFMKGKYLQMAVAPNGSFISTVDAPLSYTTSSGYFSMYDPSFAPSYCYAGVLSHRLGFVYDYGHDGWTTGSPGFFGDFSAVGLPQEGWSVAVGNSSFNAYSYQYQRACSGFTNYMRGSNTGYNEAGAVKQGNWAGNLDAVNVSVTQTTQLDTMASWIKVTTKLVNSSSDTVRRVFFNRTIDPDNDYTISGNPATANTIHSKPISQLYNNKILVTAKGTSDSRAFVGIATRDTRAKAYIVDSGSVPTNNLSGVWYDSASYYLTGSTTGDNAIGLVFNIGNLAPRDSAILEYAYMFSDTTAVDSVLPAPLMMVHGHVRETTDTLLACSITGPVYDTITLLNSQGMRWSWAPATGLSSTTGAHCVVDLSATSGTAIYTITGTPLQGYDTTKRVFLLVVAHRPDSIAISGPITVCGNSSIVLAGPSGGAWSSADTSIAMVGSSTGMLTGRAAGTSTVTCTLANACGASTATAAVTVLPAPDAGVIAGRDTICMGSTFALVDTVSGGRWWNTDTSIVRLDSSGVGVGLYVGSSVVRYVVNNSCGADTAQINIVIVGQQWQGGYPGSETAWSQPANWSCGTVPHVTQDVLIPSGVTYYPVVDSYSNGYTRGLTVDSTARITIQSGGTLFLGGYFENNGIVTGSGVVSLNGSSGQTLTGIGHVNNLQLNNVAGAYISPRSWVTVDSVLTVQNGRLTTNDSLVLGADTFVTARLAPMGTGGSIVGKTRVMQGIQGGFRRYRFWGHPFSDTIPFSQLQQYIDITGVGGAANGFTTTTTNMPSAFRYSTLQGNANLSYDPGWKPITNAASTTADSNKMARYQGVRVYFRGAKGEGLGYASYYPSATVVGQWGNLNQGRQLVTLAKGTRTGQDYNLLSNPFASPVDLGTVLHRAKVSGNIVGGFYIWNPTLGPGGQFQAYPISTVTATPYYLQANTSFEVRANHHLDSLVFIETDKVVSPANNLLRLSNEYTEITIQDEEHHIWDRLLIRFDSSSVATQDSLDDVAKLMGGALNLYSMSADRKMQAIDVRPYDGALPIPVAVESEVTGEFNITVNQLSLPVDKRLYLHDKLLGTYTVLQTGTNYRFEIAKDGATQGLRFELTELEGVPVCTAASLTLMPNPANERVIIKYELSHLADADIRMIGPNGLVVYSNRLTNVSSGSLKVPVSSLSPGVYFVELISDKEKIVKRLIVE